jgi:hypothetical protein
MLSSKKVTMKGTLRQPFICLLSPPQTVYCTKCTYIYPFLYLFTQGGRRVEPERRGEGQQGRVQITTLGRKYQHDFMYTRN